MIAVPSESANAKLVTPAPEVDFALVLSRVIASAEDDPAQLRNIVYELARIKLQEEMSRRNAASLLRAPKISSLALESAIEQVETIHSQHASLEAIQDLKRLTDSSAINSQKPVRIVDQEVMRVYEQPFRSFLIRETPTPTRNRAWLTGVAQLLRGAVVAILTIAAFVVLDH
jgi:hypothetical protein